MPDGKILRIIKKHLLTRVSPYVIYVFGSYANGSNRDDSDIDIAFLSDLSLDPYKLFMISQELASLLHVNVDLIDLRAASTVFQAQVVGTGVVIYCGDESRRMLFEMMTLKMYAKLNEERKVVLDKIIESGSVYAE